jgi:hypothetical protein
MFLGAFGIASAIFGCRAEPPPKPVSNWTLSEARALDDFDIYWLGNNYKNLKLTSMHATLDADDVPHASFNYGEPSFAGDPGSGAGSHHLK